MENFFHTISFLTKFGQRYASNTQADRVFLFLRPTRILIRPAKQSTPYSQFELHFQLAARLTLAEASKAAHTPEHRMKAITGLTVRVAAKSHQYFTSILQNTTFVLHWQ